MELKWGNCDRANAPLKANAMSGRGNPRNAGKITSSGNGDWTLGTPVDTESHAIANIAAQSASNTGFENAGPFAIDCGCDCELDSEGGE